MPSFAVIAEGATDQAVLENILCGFFGADGEEPVVNPVQPRREMKGRVPAPGGWTLVFRSLRAGDHRKALQVNDYVVVHIDTDVCDEPGFDVPRHGPKGALRPEELIEAVKAKLVAAMDPAFYAEHAARIVFAIAVDSIECWLLPLVYEGEAAKKRKTTGCLEAADRKLRRLGRPPLSNAGSKSPVSYDKASRDYATRRTLMEHRAENPSLAVFVERLEGLTAARSLEPAPPST